MRRLGFLRALRGFVGEPLGPAGPVLRDAFAVVRKTAAAHAAAVDTLERAHEAAAARPRARLAEDLRALSASTAAAAVVAAADVAREARLVAAARLAVDRDRAELASERKRAQTALPQSDDVVKLNVGGSRFETSRAVLTKVPGSLLGRMFGPRNDETADKDDTESVDGVVFVDRDGGRFGLILDFLRDLDADKTQRAIKQLPAAMQDAMVTELDFFGLGPAVFGSRPWVDVAFFRAGPELCGGRWGCAAVGVAGRVVVFGGYAGRHASDTTEVLDAATGSFVAGPHLLKVQIGCAAAQMDEDNVLVVGGLGTTGPIGGEHLRTTEILHLPSLTLTPGPELRVGRYKCAAVPLGGGRILVVGGKQTETTHLKSTEILSLDTMTFEPGPSMHTGRDGCCAVQLDKHRILVAGGFDGTMRLRSTEVLNLRNMAFTPGPSMAFTRDECAAVAVDARHVLVVGGEDGAFHALASTEVLDVEAMAFTPGPQMETPRYACAATRCDAGGRPRILVVGGHNRQNNLATTELLALDDAATATAPRKVARDHRELPKPDLAEAFPPLMF